MVLVNYHPCNALLIHGIVVVIVSLLFLFHVSVEVISCSPGGSSQEMSHACVHYDILWYDSDFTPLIWISHNLRAASLNRLLMTLTLYP